MSIDLKNKRCPKCGGKVFVPRKEIAETFQWKSTDVCCVDHGHWVGDYNECVPPKKKKGIRKI